MSESSFAVTIGRFRVCAWCGRFALSGEWVPSDEALRRLNMEPAAITNMTHGICPECLAANPPPPKRT